jgi:heme-degrading monooxygenase HmoA
MIERHWKGIVKFEEEDNYIEHLLKDTFPKIEKINGFIKASVLKRPVANGVEILVVTVWNSMEAVQQFAGINPDKAVVPKKVQQMMITYERNVIHYEFTQGWGLKNT